MNCYSVAVRLRAEGLSPLPVAPAQDPYTHPVVIKPKKGGECCPFAKDSDGKVTNKPTPKFTGKNPSYPDKNGEPRLIGHRKYQDRQPTEAELTLWFQSTGGIGCLGSETKRFIDFDAKHFGSEAELDDVFASWLKLPGAQIERTQGGGFRVWVEFATPPDFTNFALSEGGRHIGEILGPGRFAVLAPTVGPSGRPYEVLQEGDFAKVESTESIGLYPTGSKATEKPKDRPKTQRKSQTVPGRIALEDLVKDDIKAVLNGSQIDSGDRSADLTAIAKECYGWENWGNTNNVDYSGSAEELIYRAGESLGIDTDRIDRILKTINSEDCEPACVYRGGDEFAWNRVKKLEKESYKALQRVENISTSNNSAQNGNPTQLPNEGAIDSKSNKPSIQLVAGKIINILSEIEAYLGKSTDPKDSIYLQGNTDGYYLSRLLRAGQHDRRKLIEVPKEIDTLEILATEALQYEFNKRFSFERPKGESKWVPADCPKALATQFLAMGQWSKLPKLTGISYTPILLKDGTVITEPGYHADTGMLLQFEPKEFPPILPICMKEDAIASLEILKDWLKEFPFQKPEHESAALSAVLTAVVRKLLRQAPLHALSATKAGSGKGTLVKGISTLILGGHPGAIPWTGDSEEFRKKITSFLKTGAPIGSIDNVTEALGGDVLEMVLTEPYFKDRLLGGNQMPSFSTQVTLLANGNNLRFKPDMTRRTILTILDAECESPELRNFDRDFEAFTEVNRGSLVMAAITILKAYIDCGSPDPVTPRLGSFGQWSDLVRSALVWLGLPDPVETQKEISAQDDARQLLAALLTVWFETYGSIPQTGKEVINRAIREGGDLRDVLLDICLDRKGDLSPRRLGQYLKTHNRSVVDGKRFEIGGRDRLDSIRWRVVPIPSDKKHNQPETNPANPAHNAKTTQDQAFDPAGFEKQNPALTQQPLTNGGGATYPLAGLQGSEKQNPAPSNNGKSSTSGNGAGFAGFCPSRSDETVKTQCPLKKGDRVVVTVGRYEGTRAEIVDVNADGNYDCQDLAKKWAVFRTYQASNLRRIEGANDA